MYIYVVWRMQWGNRVWFAHGSDRSPGVGILKNRFEGDVIMVDPLGHFCLAAVKVSLYAVIDWCIWL